jgi:hypothetical protein
MEWWSIGDGGQRRSAERRYGAGWGGGVKFAAGEVVLDGQVEVRPFIAPLAAAELHRHQVALE